MGDRESIIAYIEAKAALLRANSDEGKPGWAMARHDARELEILASNIRAGFDMEEAA